MEEGFQLITISTGAISLSPFHPRPLHMMFAFCAQNYNLFTFCSYNSLALSERKPKNGTSG
jgi:hypothetical protein